MSKVIFVGMAANDFLDKIQRLASLHGSETAPDYMEYKDMNQDSSMPDITESDLLDSLANLYDDVQVVYIPFSDKKSSYNGYPNYQTWLVFTDFLQGEEEYVAEANPLLKNPEALAEILKDIVMDQWRDMKNDCVEMYGELAGKYMAYSRIMIEQVDFVHIAETVWNEYREEAYKHGRPQQSNDA